MVYNQYPYDFFNQNYLREIASYRQQIEEQNYHAEQQKAIFEMRKAVADYCKAARKVSPEYHSRALNECLQEVANQAAIDGFYMG